MGILSHQQQGLGDRSDSSASKFTFANSATQGVGAIADQGLFAIANFSLNLILARRMEPTQFGAFSAAFAAFLLVSTIYSAVVTEPMLIFSLSSRAQHQQSYVNRVGRLHWRAAFLVSATVATLGVVRYAIHPQSSSIFAYLGWAAAAPLVLWLWFARRTAYITRTPHRAAVAGAGYLLCMTSLLVAFGRIVPKYPLLTCLLFAVPSMIVAPLLRMRVPLKDLEQTPATDLTDIWAAHWAYGKWASLGSLCAALIAPIYFFVLPLEGCAAYRAIMNIPMPLLQTYTALGPAFIALFTPLRGKPQLRRAVTQSLAAVGGAALLFASVASLFSKDLLKVLYANKYTAYSGELWPLMIYSFLVAASVVLDSAMRSMGRVRTATVASVTAVVVSFVAGIPAALMLGVKGAVYGLVTAQFAGLCVLVFAWIQMHDHSASVAGVAKTTHLTRFSEAVTKQRICNDV